VSITGLGCYAPERVMTNEELAQLVDTSDDWIRERTGIRERRVAAVRGVREQPPVAGHAPRPVDVFRVDHQRRQRGEQQHQDDDATREPLIAEQPQ
jgi:hypothetical protein